MSILGKIKGTISDAKSKVKDKLNSGNVLSSSSRDSRKFCSDGSKHSRHRFQSFAPEREGNHAKWYVDGCSYMHAVSVALENAQHEIWILDWWLSPELYLRRPPAQNEQYRLDRLLFQAANRGVQVNIIVYKEVSQALTLNSSHTKHWLEDNDKSGNIHVFRHPYHIPDRKALLSSAWSSIKEGYMSPNKLWSLPGEALNGLYGMSEGSILYWAHHEKLVLIDRHIAFLGGLDLCYGRWDTNQHSIADVHPGDLNRIIFPGQDYNNARVMDFHDVPKWDSNKLERTTHSRMGWSDVALCITGPVTDDLVCHFAQRWNRIFRDKYNHKDPKYTAIEFSTNRTGIVSVLADDSSSSSSDDDAVNGDDPLSRLKKKVKDRVDNGKAKLHLDRLSLHSNGSKLHLGGTHVQLMRSASKWSHGCNTEHSIMNAYIDTIGNSKHFIYIENQFFITASSAAQKPVENRIGEALVDRVVRAARDQEAFHIIVVMPAVPAFAGDLKADESLGTRAIMEFQYESINRGGHSIMERIAAAGVDPLLYIRFYNLRSYDRINNSAVKTRVEQESGVPYDEAAKGFDQQHGEQNVVHPNPQIKAQQKEGYQQVAQNVNGSLGGNAAHWDSVAACYMRNGPDIRSVPWDGDPQTELDAFVSEELYIHSKLLIADDRVVICGSANINDRSQLGVRDSEIAVLIEDSEEFDSVMAGRTWRATRFAASLRRHIFQKHLGLLDIQDPSTPDTNYSPLPEGNRVEWGSPEDLLVADPLSEEFQTLWQGTAATNTAAFGKVFHPVPTDAVKNWRDYQEYYGRFFGRNDAEGKGKDPKKPSQYQWGHVVAEEFLDGAEGVKQVKEELSKIRGNLVEMPLLFLREEDIAVENMTYNSWTKEVYT